MECSFELPAEGKYTVQYYVMHGDKRKSFYAEPVKYTTEQEVNE